MQKLTIEHTYRYQEVWSRRHPPSRRPTSAKARPAERARHRHSKHPVSLGVLSAGPGAMPPLRFRAA